MLKTVTLAIVVFALVVITGMAIAQPERDINPQHHPNLAAAQKFSQQAFEKMEAAQRANEWDMQGHAEKAKQLLMQVNHELKLAAEAANKHHK